MTDYALILGLIVVVVLSTLSLLGNKTFNAICNVSGGLSRAAAIAGRPTDWGDNQYGELGNGSSGVSPVRTPTISNGSLCSVQIAGGSDHTVSLSTDGTVWAWGDDSYGELGDGVTLPFAGDQTNPVHVVGVGGSGILSGVSSISAAGLHSMALANGNVYMWGNDTTAGFGNSSTPIEVLAGDCTCGGGTYLNNVVQISAGINMFEALRSDGTVWSWGYNSQDDFGNTHANSTTPTEVCAASACGGNYLTNVKAISAGGYYGMALLNDGTVWSWGNNDLGELGNGLSAPTSNPNPVQVVNGACVCDGSHLTNVIMISAGIYQAYAETADGNVWAWGYNYAGELGTNSAHGLPSNYFPSPLQVKGANNVGFLTGPVALNSGGPNGWALMRDGTVLGWGGNGQGQLENQPATVPYPVVITGLTGVTSVGSGSSVTEDHAMALTR